MSTCCTSRISVGLRLSVATAPLPTLPLLKRLLKRVRGPAGTTSTTLRSRSRNTISSSTTKKLSSRNLGNTSISVGKAETDTMLTCDGTTAPGLTAKLTRLTLTRGAFLADSTDC